MYFVWWRLGRPASSRSPPYDHGFMAWRVLVRLCCLYLCCFVLDVHFRLLCAACESLECAAPLVRRASVEDAHDGKVVAPYVLIRSRARAA